MRRADRLFDVIQILRRGRVTRARELAEKLEVSERTIYRDIADLMASGVPIEGEAGVGYLLRGFDLPPLMFDKTELEALVLGARIVQSWADPELAQAAGKAVAKIEAAVSDSLRSFMDQIVLLAPLKHYAEPVGIDLAALRRAINGCRKIAFRYPSSPDSEVRERCVRPLALSFYGPVWLLIAWCELRNDFRCFRPDRMAELQVLETPFPPERGKTLGDFLARDAG